MKFSLCEPDAARSGGSDRRWPEYLFNGRIRTSTVVLIVAFAAVWWVYATYRTEPEPPAAPQVVPPGFLPDPAYTWVPRTRLQPPPATVSETPTPTTTTETTSPTEPPSGGPQTPTPGFPFCPPLCPPPAPAAPEQPGQSPPPGSPPSPAAPGAPQPSGQPGAPAVPARPAPVTSHPAAP